MSTAVTSVVESDVKSAREVREDLLAGCEIALLDVREEALHAQGHPLFAANLPVSRLELEAYARIPRRAAPIVVFDDGEGLAVKAAALLQSIGYEDVRLLHGGLEGWRNAGFELFRDVNAPSKAFGELVESRRNTPFVSAQELKALIDAKADIVVVDVRRFDEFHTMSIPTATSVPGAELALRIRELTPSPNTRVIVNCAGRTRSIVGAQSLINLGLPNPVAALRNGTIGWTLASQHLDYGQTRTGPKATRENQSLAARSALRIADAAGVDRTLLGPVELWSHQADATVYCFDVRSPEEFERGHLAGFRNAPGGQLVQETDMFAPVRNARIVLADDDGVRANMTASWLAQMNWKVAVVDGLTPDDFRINGPWRNPLPPSPLPPGTEVSAAEVRQWQSGTGERIAVLDLSPHRQYARRHIPGSVFIQRAHLEQALEVVRDARKIVLVSTDGIASRFAWQDAAAAFQVPVFLLQGGVDAWVAEGLRADATLPQYACQPTDRYQRPYEGKDVDAGTMQAYLDWEYGLVEQLERDGTHGFFVL